MRGKYKAAFIIPKGSNKVLGEEGWEFVSDFRLSPAEKEYLIETLKLEFVEHYLGIDSYVGENIKMSVAYDDQNNIENIYFQLYENALNNLEEIYLGGKLTSDSEFFIPNP